MTIQEAIAELQKVYPDEYITVQHETVANQFGKVTEVYAGGVVGRVGWLADVGSVDVLVAMLSRPAILARKFSKFKTKGCSKFSDILDKDFKGAL